MKELAPDIIKLAVDCGAKHTMPFNAGFNFSYPNIEKFHDEVIKKAYDDLRVYISWALMDAIDDEKIKTEIMLDIMDKFENKYKGLRNV
jgi:hypothetical protein